MTDERIDLSPLDPARDPDRVERIMGAVRAGIAGSGSIEPWTAPLARAWIPALLAAAIAGLLAVSAPRSLEQPAPTAGTADPLAISIGVPAPIARWAASEEPPSAAEVLAAMEAHAR
ncbi:MAG: hypothetical protein ACREK2_10790 [Gemmatimonadota bacterium]